MEDVQVVAMLVRRCVAGDAAAWEEIVQTYNRRIYNICYRFAGSADNAEDLAQEVFIKMYRTLASYDHTKGAFGTWTGTPAESTGDTFTSTPLAVSPGYFSMSQLNLTPNPLAATIAGLGPGTFDADIYQASGTTLYWLEFDLNGMFLGPIEAQDLTGIPAVRRPATKPKVQPKTQTIKGLGGHIN